MDQGARADPDVDRAVRVTVPSEFAELAGAVLMEVLGPFEEQISGDAVALVFYPPAGETPSLADVLEALPPEMGAQGRVRLEVRDVSRDWVDGWKDHFRPLVVGSVRIRPPWEEPLGAGRGAVTPGAVTPDAAADLIDVVINPGLGFGTGLHPTTRGTLRLLQGAVAEGAGVAPRPRGPLVDAGTGSGILAVAAAKLGWSPVHAFDNDPVALISARENVEANGVGQMVEIREAGVEGVPLAWFEGATVLANMTLEPVIALLRRLASETATEGTLGRRECHPTRVVVSGILAGAQEHEVVKAADRCGLVCDGRAYEAEWVSMEFVRALGDERAPSGADSSPHVGGR